MTSYRGLSLWHDTAGEEWIPRPPLVDDGQADVAIVGAGYTGLWTAYYLQEHAPQLKVVIIEAEVAGFGASGRNGGWCAGEIAGNRHRLAARHGRAAVIDLWREMFRTVDEVGRVAAEEGIDCHFEKGGILRFATNEAQLLRLQEEIAEERSWGFGEEDFRFLDVHQLEGRARVAGSRGALYTPHAAAIHPARLVRGLARAVEKRGAEIYERTRVVEFAPHQVVTEGGATVVADSVLRCTEAFTVQLSRHSRTYLPVYSLMVATEPLGDAFWRERGFAAREVFNDARHLVIYGQRTADGRLAFGGRGARYHFGSAVRPEYDRQPRVHAAVEAILRSLFPGLEAAITHRWGGAVAIPRDWRPAVVFDPATRLGWAGGYVGEGVAASNLAGRTLTDMVLGRDTDLLRLPWVQHRARKWEPEPLRFVGVNAAAKLAPAADRFESRRGRPSKLAAGLLDRLTGR
jgi:glycine/D-amino acid oxidase-like deaminating enzyme